MQDKKDIRPRNDKGQYHGCWEFHSSLDDSYYKLHFVNDEVFGYCEVSNYTNGEIIDKEYYAR
jgi:hypothetical protein